jgi:hypothetical protein
MLRTAVAILMAVALVGCAHTKATPTAKAPAAKAEPDPKQYQGPPPQAEPQVRLTVSWTAPKGWEGRQTPDGTRAVFYNKKLKAGFKLTLVPSAAANPLLAIMSVQAEMKQVKGKMKVKTSPGVLEIAVSFPSKQGRIAGKLVIRRFEGTPASAVVIGTWPQRNDRRVLKDFDAFWKGIEVKAETVPAEPPASQPAK